jgi:hypothetical protein
VDYGGAVVHAWALGDGCRVGGLWLCWRACAEMREYDGGLRLAWRALSRRPGFATAILTIGLGVELVF